MSIMGTSSIQLDFEEYNVMRAKWANEARGNLDGEDCPICKNRGYTVEARNGTTVCVECACMAKRRSIKRIEKSGLGDMVKRYTFDNYQTPEVWQENAKKKAIQYMKNPCEQWFVACGCVGSGKTHLCTAICSELMNSGLEVRYMRWKDDGGRMKAAVNDSDEYRNLVEPMKRVSVLYIDDFWKAGKSSVTKGDIDLAFEILNARYNTKNLITIISSEHSIKQMVNIDEAVGSRIYERSKETCLEMTGNKNWRLRP